MYDIELATVYVYVREIRIRKEAKFLEFKKLNNAFKVYKADPTQSNLTEVYRIAQEIFLYANRGKLLAMGCRDTNDADSVFNDVFVKVTRKEVVLDLGAMLRTSLRNARVNFMESEKRRGDRVSKYLDDDDEGQTQTPEQMRSRSAEHDVFYSEKEKEANQRQLVDFILESAKIHLDPMMIAVIERIKLGETPNAIATSFGVKRNVIDRMIRKLARWHNPEVHGTITDYMPEGPRLKREFISA